MGKNPKKWEIIPINVMYAGHSVKRRGAREHPTNIANCRFDKKSIWSIVYLY
ncbi:hypothetical protein KJZ61_02205 [Candidatus Dependentiae bacterium]|nr:hypothetical protein [Candidatus Dependentiae bacterium]